MLHKITSKGSPPLAEAMFLANLDFLVFRFCLWFLVLLVQVLKLSVEQAWPFESGFDLLVCLPTGVIVGGLRHPSKDAAIAVAGNQRDIAVCVQGVWTECI